MKWSGTDRPVLVIGYGNSLRRDDGAGLILAAGLVDAWRTHDLPASLITAHQLSPELADDIARSGADHCRLCGCHGGRGITGRGDCDHADSIPLGIRRRIAEPGPPPHARRRHALRARTVRVPRRRLDRLHSRLRLRPRRGAERPHAGVGGWLRCACNRRVAPDPRRSGSCYKQLAARQTVCESKPSPPHAESSTTPVAQDPIQLRPILM